jgi:hypothetical protein
MAGRNSVHGAAVPRQWATHGGEDVPIYAQVRYPNNSDCLRVGKNTVRQTFLPRHWRYFENSIYITLLKLQIILREYNYFYFLFCIMTNK